MERTIKFHPADGIGTAEISDVLREFVAELLHVAPPQRVEAALSAWVEFGRTEKLFEQMRAAGAFANTRN